jgi:hypothetical protein
MKQEGEPLLIIYILVHQPVHPHGLSLFILLLDVFNFISHVSIRFIQNLQGGLSLQYMKI